MRRNVKSPAVLRGSRSRRRSATTTQAVADAVAAVAAAHLIGVPPHELIRRRYVEKADTVRYGPHPRVNLADIWRRRDLPRDGKAPVLLQVPGGAWAIGMRRPQAYPLLSHLAERGWVCVSIDYRVSPRHTWPDHIVDVKRALAWIKEHIAEYGGDPDFVAITGGSAGGHLSCAGGADARRPAIPARFRGRRHLGGRRGTDLRALRLVHHQGTRPLGIRPHAAATFVVKKRLTKHLQVYRDASPITRVRPDAPPFFVLHGVDDSLIPVREAREFVAALRDVSKVTVAYSEIPHAQHAFDFFGSPRAPLHALRPSRSSCHGYTPAETRQ